MTNCPSIREGAHEANRIAEKVRIAEKAEREAGVKAE